MGKIILITGASSGMGKEIANALIQQGHTVYTVARRVDHMEDLKQMGGYPIQMDVANEKDIEHGVQTIIREKGRVDVLWNNAGYNLYCMNAQDKIHYFLKEEANNILLNSNNTVSEVAYSLGFECPQYFSKLFKQKTGKTPLECQHLN